MTTFLFFLACMAVLFAGGYAVTGRWDDAPPEHLTLRNDKFGEMARVFNNSVRVMEYDYKNMKRFNMLQFGTEAKKREYSDLYEKLKREHDAAADDYKRQWAQSHPLWAKARRLWGRIFAIGMVGGMVCCSGTMIADSMEEDADGRQTLADGTEVRFWNAQNIPIPYLQDATQYVSNPDSVLSQHTVDSMNVVLKALENECDIQTVVVVVNHIENDDPFRMAQDIGNSYGVGRRDRGLVVVVGYADHSINMSPGRALEADLTDAECYNLEQAYVVPAMRANDPNSAMLRLTQALYALMLKKEPPTTALVHSGDESSDNGLTAEAIPLLYMSFYIAWGLLFSFLNRKYQWVPSIGSAALMANPFIEQRSSGVSAGRGIYGGGGGGGFSGGSFGGGSFGGGGASSRW